MSGDLAQKRDANARAAGSCPVETAEGDCRWKKRFPAPPAAERPMRDRLVRLPEVLDVCAFSRSTLYNKLAKGQFPQQVRLGANIVAWYESDVLAWMQSPT
jgi:predicted DNA-binding transcriptional regulator AlpA